MKTFNNFENFPKEVQLRIFSFLPLKTLFSLKTLNKGYNELIKNTGFQTNIIFNSIKEMENELGNSLINFMKISMESPLDNSYCYLSNRENLENVIVIRSEVEERTIEGIGKKMKIYIKCKAKIENDEKIEYSTLTNNSKMLQLISKIKNCQKVVVREKDLEEPTVDNIPGNQVLTLFSLETLYQTARNAPPLYSSSQMKTILMDKTKSIPILYGFLEADLVLELYNMNFPLIETFEFTTTSKDNSKKMKRCIRLDPLQQIKSFHFNNVTLIEHNKSEIEPMTEFIKKIFMYFKNS